MSRGAAGGCTDKADSSGGTAVTYGKYFSVLQSALAANRCAALCEAITAISQNTMTPDRIEGVEIQLLKHGHFYHPACVVVRTAGFVHRLALNAALCPDGMALLPKETQALDTLAQQAGFSSVPRVLARGRCKLGKGLEWGWFLAPWFDDFHEFHLTRLGDGHEGVTVWDGAPNPTFLNPAQTDIVLEGAARILTAAFNPHTLAHIFPWHHAAGDFVVRGGDTDHPVVRLITVRDYQPLLPPSEGQEDDFLDRLLYALLLLVTQAALRLRVDRLDGVGGIALYPEAALGAICRGCLEGIYDMCRRWDLPLDLGLAAREYLSSPSLEEVSQLSAMVYGGFALGSPEREAIAPYFERHVRSFYAQLQLCAQNRPAH